MLPTLQPLARGELGSSVRHQFREMEIQMGGERPRTSPSKEGARTGLQDSDTAQRDKKVPQILSREQLILFKLLAGEAE